MNTSQSQNKFSHSHDADTLGIVADLRSVKGRMLVQEILKQTNDPEFRNLISMADTLNKRYIIAAGSFNGRGILSVLCDDEQTLIAACQNINIRMDEIGSSTTAWLISPNNCAILLKEALAQSTKKGKK
ncbi:hypothetical protein [Nitrosomonas communis]|uniref:Uncharacterized protein n=1 Tax=Nitrosomonas communis TaxID=44574 RepID=A0A1I4S3S2_9PROT|nr:hypothetical protein [Nitrosomonas communis]SFM59127.1 hypothetical protein SAMN05421863_103727 [Nitrosomonas communis]